jgi:RimJ/RimL family protein N-acetyltransferase
MSSEGRLQVVLRTERVVLRRWRDEDRAPFAALNADPVVMEFFPSVLTRTESDAFVDRIEARFDEVGFGFWAVEVPGVASFIGLVGLATVSFEGPLHGAIEVGWRLDRPYWGFGYASEAAAAALRYGFEELAQSDIVSFTARINLRSQRVMQKLAMTNDPDDDFEHPRMPEGHPLRAHVLYRIDRQAWAAGVVTK